MTTSDILVLGGTGKTGRRLAAALAVAGARPRTAARSGGDVRFDWSDPATHAPALEGVGAVYLVSPAMRVDHAPDVAAFLDRAEQAGVTHVTLLSARGVDLAPPEAAMRAIELDLQARSRLTSTVLRPAWFLQNFSEGFFTTIASEGTIVAPSGDGREAFIDTEDIAAVAAASLLDPAAHAGREYELTGPEALTFGDVAARIGAVTGRPVRHVDPGRAAWVGGLADAGVPQGYAELLGDLMDVIRAGHGAVPNGVVQDVLGRPARGFADFAARPEAVASWTPQAAVA